MEFQALLLQVGQALRKQEVKALAFLCTDLVGQNLSSVESAGHLFSLLGDKDLLTAERPHLLADLLIVIHRRQLVRNLGLNDYISTTRRHITPYRKLLYDLSEDVTDDDLKNIKFLLSNSLPRSKLDNSPTTLEVFLEMEHMDLLSATNLDLLEQIIQKICPVLQKKINQFKEQNVTETGPITQETVAGRSRSASDVAPHEIPQSLDLNRRASCEFPGFHDNSNSQELLPPSFFETSQTLAQSSSQSFSHTSVDFQKELKDEELSHKMDHLSTGTSSCASSKEKSNVMTLLQSSVNQTSSKKEPLGPEHSQTTNTAVEELGTYPMTSAKRGICLIVNNYDFSDSIKPLKNRKGTITDEKSLEIVFKWLGFDIEIKNDCTRDEMLSVVQELSSRDHSQMDCVVCCILSHGMEGCVYGVDGQTVTFRELTEPFSGLFCPSLVEKPKLFFIQACQGTREQKAVPIQADGPVSCGVHSDAFVPEDSIPSLADFLMSKATVLHYVSFRDKKRGTWFIQSLCRNLIQLVPGEWDLISILTKVNADVSQETNRRGNTKQMPQPEFSLRKKVVFPVPQGPPPSLPL